MKTARLKRPQIAPAEPSWWLREALAAETGDGEQETPPPSDVDVAIVGGGYTGLWTALALRDRAPSLSVAVLEAQICGAGASGKNGGFVHGYWSALPRNAQTFGDGPALEIARLGTLAQDALRAFCTTPAVDVWWREDGIVKIACSPQQEENVERLIATTRRLGVAQQAVPLSQAQVRARCESPVFRRGVLMTEGATVQPARLARALRRAALGQGVAVAEGAAICGLRSGAPNVLRTSGGEVRAHDVVLASNATLAGWPGLKRKLTNFSSFMVVTEPVPEKLRTLGWTGGEGLDDARMFVHYFRTTPDGRVAMGSGSGPLAFDGRLSRSLIDDAATAARAETALRRLLPGLGDARVTHAWGGPIDVAADHLPFCGTLPGTRVHYGCGYSGHGVNPSWIAGQTLASLVLRQDDEWTRSPFARPNVPSFPPEPLRFLGGRLIRASLIRCEEAD
ncbi:MAG: FAD-dependent oxidoreductase, partial [Candidatus Eremiobacteraeota bacterium]|nr:FAD-dependent oxidoreductase [Candidatus Eremiobacteraeota bacterium]